MDKRTVIAAYYRGELSLQECAQILGLELHPMEQCLEHSRDVYDDDETVHSLINKPSDWWHWH